MTIYFATDHSGLTLKDELLLYVRDELGCAVEDCGTHHHDPEDDYPDFVQVAAEKVAAAPMEHRAIIIGASGQGEAMVANRYKGVRAAVYYGAPATVQTDAEGQKLSMIASSRLHNDANVLSLAARFITTEEAKAVVKEWLQIKFSGAPRHVRRIKKIDSLT